MNLGDVIPVLQLRSAAAPSSCLISHISKLGCDPFTWITRPLLAVFFVNSNVYWFCQRQGTLLCIKYYFFTIPSNYFLDMLLLSDVSHSELLNSI